jgi:hypothetical protein
MPVKNAFASASLTCDPIPGKKFHVTLKVWSHSYDDPNPARRNALIRKVELTGLAGNQNNVNNVQITDRYGIDETKLWTPSAGVDAGFDGYTEVGPVKIGTTSIPVIWGAYTGIYDERCLADAACDAMRLQTFRPDANRIAPFNYLLGPVTFSFDIAQPAAPKSVRLTMGLIGGNGGNPAQRSPAPGEDVFVISFP